MIIVVKTASLAGAVFFAAEFPRLVELSLSYIKVIYNAWHTWNKKDYN
jgi:hypothetical protein